MSGIYIHIPFCKKACHYCNFHFSTSTKHQTEVVNAICNEIEWQAKANYLPSPTLNSVYFGGGTPSMLSTDELLQIFDRIQKHFSINNNAEITLEANPDDLTTSKIKEYRPTPINRFSIGVQSFAEADLKYMNRAHNATEAMRCIQLAQDAGFENLTIDLIYGTPTLSDEQWLQNLNIATDLNIPHLSCYALTVEERTALAHFVATGKSKPVSETQTARQFALLMDHLEAKGYEHYEISSFAKPNFRAVHNSGYWRGKPYLGVGPSANSFDGSSRQWNVSNNALYVKSIEADTIPFERELLSQSDRYNELIMTGLRTSWGIDIQQLRAIDAGFASYFEQNVQPFLSQHLVRLHPQLNTYVLTRKGKFLADTIMAELFWVIEA